MLSNNTSIEYSYMYKDCNAFFARGRVWEHAYLPHREPEVEDPTKRKKIFIPKATTIAYGSILRRYVVVLVILLYAYNIGYYELTILVCLFS